MEFLKTVGRCGIALWLLRLLLSGHRRLFNTGCQQSSFCFRKTAGTFLETLIEILAPFLVLFDRSFKFTARFLGLATANVECIQFTAKLLGFDEHGGMPQFKF